MTASMRRSVHAGVLTPRNPGANVAHHGMRRLHRTCRLGPPLLLALSASCRPQDNKGWNWGIAPAPKPNSPATPTSPAADAHPFAEFVEPRTPADGELEVLLVRFEVLRVELPAEPIRHSLNIWEHADGLRVDPEAVVRLARNGLRIGVVTQNNWPAIQAILRDSVTPSVASAQSLQTGFPLFLHVGDVEPGETLFIHHADGRLIGRTLDAGRKTIRLEYETLPPRRDRLRMWVELNVLAPERTSAWTLIPESPNALVPLERFRELTASLILNPGDVMILGPNENTPETDVLLGSRYLTSARGGRRTDTLVFVTVTLDRRKLRS